jgi:hypothetical protein
MRRGLKAALATIGHERAARDGGWPRVSLVSTACDCDGAPILLLSDIALHSREIRRDNRVSRLFDLAGK